MTPEEEAQFRKEMAKIKQDKVAGPSSPASSPKVSGGKGKSKDKGKGKGKGKG